MEAWTKTQANGDPQVDALLCLSRRDPGRDVLARARDILGGSFEWDRFLELAETHQVFPLVATQLATTFGDICPPTIVDRSREILCVATMRGMMMEQELATLVELFERNDIAVIAYKGPVLAAGVYGHPGLRLYGDLDVLVSRWDFHFGVRELLLREGWTAGQTLSFERSFEYPARGLCLDVHARFAPENSMPVGLDFDVLRPRSKPIMIARRRIQTFADSDLLLVLCVQLVKDVMDLDRPIPLLKVCDIAETLRSRPGDSWNTTIELARESGLSRILGVGIRVAGDLLDAPVPIALQRWIDDPETARLARHAAERVLDVPASDLSSPDLLDRKQWHRALRERWRHRWQTSAEPVRYALVPNSADYEWVRLPRALFLLYFLVRPLRLAMKPLLRLGGIGRTRDPG